jgi:hypothetical protein
MIENTHANDTLTISMVQKDGESVLSEMTLNYPNLPNAMANAMSLQIVETLLELTKSWSDAKASGEGMFRR